MHKTINTSWSLEYLNRSLGQRQVIPWLISASGEIQITLSMHVLREHPPIFFRGFKILRNFIFSFVHQVQPAITEHLL